LTLTIDQIRDEWLGGARIAASEDELVGAFNRCNAMLGREWLEACRGQFGQGALSTWMIGSMGQSLSSLDGMVGAEQLVDRIRSGDVSAVAELAAVHLLRSSELVEVELQPAVKVGEGQRVPDFRIRNGKDGPWIYVEVTQPDTSQAQERVSAILNQFMALIVPVRKSFAMEVYFRREPSADEVASASACVAEVVASDRNQTLQMPDDLGLVIRDQSVPGQVVLKDHDPEDRLPRLGASMAVMGQDEPPRHISVRMPFSDDRAMEFLASESKQLSKEFPGLIMVQVSRAPGSFVSWEPLIKRRFQPTIHTRVGGVALFAPRQILTGDGMSGVVQTKLLLNPNAALPLPAWIGDTIVAVGRKYEETTAKAMRDAGSMVSE